MNRKAQVGVFSWITLQNGISICGEAFVMNEYRWSKPFAIIRTRLERENKNLCPTVIESDSVNKNFIKVTLSLKCTHNKYVKLRGLRNASDSE